jgi:hypothetical protein
MIKLKNIVFGRVNMEKNSTEPAAKQRRPFFASFANRIGSVFLAPDDTFNQIVTDKVSFWEPFLLVVMLAAIEDAIVSSFAYRIVSAITNVVNPLTGATTPIGLTSIILASMVFMMVTGTLILWVIITGIAHLVARYIFKGQGSFLHLMKLYGYAFVPYSLVILGTVLVGLSWTTWPVAAFLSIITTFWIVLLMAVAVKHNYKINIGKGFISSFIGPMLVWLIIVGIFWVWMLLIIRSFTGGIV